MWTIRLTETEYNDLFDLADAGLKDIHYCMREIEPPLDCGQQNMQRLLDNATNVFSALYEKTRHWTDEHILRQGNEYVGFDEAGQELVRHPNWDEVRDTLVVYAKTELGS